MTCVMSDAIHRYPFSVLEQVDEEGVKISAGSLQEDEAALLAALAKKKAATEAEKDRKAAQAEDLRQANSFPKISFELRDSFKKPGSEPLGSTKVLIAILMKIANDANKAADGRLGRDAQNLDMRKLMLWLANDAPGYVDELPTLECFTPLRTAIQAAAKAVQERNQNLEEAVKEALRKAETERLCLPQQERRGQTSFVGVYNRWGRFQFKINPTDEFSKNEFYNTAEEAALALARAMKDTTSVGT